jgi:prevent-host-death family protein
MSDYIDPPDDALARIGVRELKAQAARIVRRVRETQATYVVTHRGHAAAVILPVNPNEPARAAHDDSTGDEAWAAFLRAGRRIQGRFTARKSGVQMLSRSRR